MRVHQPVQEEVGWQMRSVCARAVDVEPWGAALPGPSTTAPLCSSASASVLVQLLPALPPRDVLAWGDSSAPLSSQVIMTCAASCYQPLFQLTSNTGKFSNYVPLFGEETAFGVSLHVKSDVGISVGPSVQGLCQERGGKRAESVSPRSSEQDQAMMLHKTCCSSTAGTSPEVPGEQRETEVKEGPCCSWPCPLAQCWCSLHPDLPEIHSCSPPTGAVAAV